MSRKVLTLWAVLLAATPLAGAGCETVGFSGATELYGGSAQPHAPAFLNLNRDAWPDLIVAGSQPNDKIGSILVIPGNGRTWSASQELTLNHQVTDIAVGDFDGDGDDDLVYIGFRDLHILTNEGATLRETAVQPLPGAIHDGIVVVSGDFNGDGRHDFAVGYDGALLFLSRGDGTFEQIALLGTTVRAYQMAAGDLDGDGRDELVIGRPDSDTAGQLLVFRGEASGLGAPRMFVTRPSLPTLIQIGDIDGDGAMDILFFTPNVWLDVILRATDPGSQVQRITAYTPPARFAPFLVADLNGDGADDLVDIDYTFGLRVLFGSRGTILPPANGHWLPLIRLVGGAMDAADVDQDGDADLAVVTEHGFSILKNDGAGRFDSPTFATHEVAVGDFNGDGRDDLVDQTGVRLADARGRFTPLNEAEYYVRVPPDTFYIPAFYWSGETADMNGDGHLDMVYYRNRNAATRGLVVRLGDGTGALGPEGPLYRTSGNKQDLAIADINGDGNLDAISPGSSQTSTIALGDGKGGFVDPVHDPVFNGEVAVGDLDGDGDVDVAANQGSIFLNDGKGVFATPIALTSWYDVAIADMNRDGRLDIVTASDTYATQIRVFLGREGGFSKTPDFTAGDLLKNLDTIQIGDFNRDGIPDALVTERDSSASEGWMVPLLGDGTGRLLPQPKIPLTNIRTRLGDFNGDGATDVIDGGFPRLNACSAPKRRAARH